jgi:hypothetical protein
MEPQVLTGEIVNQDEWYGALVEDCKAIITEGIFNSRWALLEMYHQLGERIVTDNNLQWNARGNGATLQDLAKYIGLSTRTLYYAIQFYEKYPDLSLVPEGKNISWNKIVTKYLPAEDREQPPNPLNSGAAGADLAFSAICNAIDEKDSYWLLSEDCLFYFDTLKLPMSNVLNWARTGCKSIEEILKEELMKQYKTPNLEDVEDESF